jgi:hypothetical protein
LWCGFQSAGGLIIDPFGAGDTRCSCARRCSIEQTSPQVGARLVGPKRTEDLLKATSRLCQSLAEARMALSMATWPISGECAKKFLRLAGRFCRTRTGAPDVLALRYDWRNNSVVLLHNLNSAPREVRINAGLQGEAGTRLVNLLSGEHSVADESGRHCIRIEGYGYRWFRADGLRYVLN